MKEFPMVLRWALLCCVVLFGVAAWATATRLTGLHAVPAPGAVVIDGRLGEWDTSGCALLCTDLETLRDTMAAQVAFMYDAENLYVAVQWKDATPMVNRHDPRTDLAGWAGDCLQLRLRTDRITSVTAWYYTPGQEPCLQLQAGKGANPFGGTVRTLLRTTGWELQDGAAMAFMADADGKGYVQELRLPWTLITDGPRPHAGEQITCGIELLWGNETGASVQRRMADNTRPGRPAADENSFYLSSEDWGTVTLEPAGQLHLPAPAWVAQVGRKDALTIAPFRGNADAAISFTLDDGSQNQLDIATPIFNEFGVKATFFVVSGVVREKKTDPLPKGASHAGNGGLSWEELRQLAAMGHEIGNHSLTHRRLIEADPAVLEHEINDSYTLIAEKIGQPPLTFCYPGNGRDGAARAVVLQRHLADRTSCVTYGGDPAKFTLATANGYLDAAMQQHAWVVPMIHGIEEGYSPLDRTVLRAHLAYLAQLGPRVWADTFANVARYRQERDAAVLQVTAQRSTSVTFTLTTPLDPARYTMPLTVCIPTPGKTAAHVRVLRKHAHPLPVQARADMLLVDVMPGREPVTVR
jgi:peptidoglycan/xylan/chitin deacetylase (PgdA/CDA1 family)